MSYTIKIPSDVKDPCCEDSCPFYDFGDSGYGEHCNLFDSEIFMSPNTLILHKRYMKLRVTIYDFINKKHRYIHGQRKPGRKSWGKYAERSNKRKKLDRKLNNKLWEAEKYYKKCPFYGLDFELKIPIRL